MVNGRDVTKLPEAARDRFRASLHRLRLSDVQPAAGVHGPGERDAGDDLHRRRSPTPSRAAQLLTDVGLGHRLTHKPRALSVGEQQRVAVARALANRPVLLLADEPTANVDPAHQQQVIDLLRAACERENIAMLLVTHSPEVSQQFSRVEELEQVNRAARVA